MYRKYEEESYVALQGLIARVDGGSVPHAVFYDFAKRIYKRMK